MTEFLNILVAVLTVGFGAIGFLKPEFALSALKLQRIAGHNDGLSEMRAASGGAFVATAALALALQSPLCYLMLGAQYVGASVGRLTSILFDDAGSKKMWAFFLIEAACSVWLVTANWV
jgi:hypothetical protein